MQPFFGPRFGNPSSMHRWGREARTALDEARERVARCLGAPAGRDRASPRRHRGATTWRSSASGARGAAKGRSAVVTTPIEHKAVLGAVHQAAQRGRRGAAARGRRGRRRRRRVVRRARATTTSRSCSVMWVNNEIGTMQADRRRSPTRAKARGVVFHTDAVQAFGKVEIDARTHAVRPALDLGPQDRRAEGHRRAVHPPRHADRAADVRRRRRIAAAGRARRTSRWPSASPAPRSSRSPSARTECARLEALRDRLEAAIARARSPTPSSTAAARRARRTSRTSRCRARTASRCSWRSTCAASPARPARRARAGASRRRTCSRRSASRPTSRTRRSA